MSRVYFRTIPTLGEQLKAVLAPRNVRRAVKIAQRISFSPRVKAQIRERAIRRLFDQNQHYSKIMAIFRSPEAVAVLAYMDVFQDRLIELETETLSATQAASPMGRAMQSRIAFYQSKLAVCAMYMRRSGYMNQATLGADLYKAAAAIETVYPALPSSENWQPSASMGDTIAKFG